MMSIIQLGDLLYPPMNKVMKLSSTPLLAGPFGLWNLSISVIVVSSILWRIAWSPTTRSLKISYRMLFCPYRDEPSHTRHNQALFGAGLFLLYITVLLTIYAACAADLY